MNRPYGFTGFSGVCSAYLVANALYRTSVLYLKFSVQWLEGFRLCLSVPECGEGSTYLVSVKSLLIFPPQKAVLALGAHGEHCSQNLVHITGTSQSASEINLHVRIQLHVWSRPLRIQGLGPTEVIGGWADITGNSAQLSAPNR
jgi:hypothetical protein